MQTSPAELKRLKQEFLRLKEARENFTKYCEIIAPDEKPEAEHHRLFCQIAQDIMLGEKRRVIIMVPPGSAKSTYFSIRFPAFYVGCTKNKGIICASHSGQLAGRFGKKVRNLVKSESHNRIFPESGLSADSQAKGEWETESGGFFFACGVEGSVTGRRADLIVADDLVKGRADADSEIVRDKTWSWWVDDLRSRLKPNGSIVLIMTRWHEDDPAGRILPEGWDGETGWIESRDGEPWYVVCLPAEAQEGDMLGRKPGEFLWLDWWDQAEWDQIKRTVSLQSKRSWYSLYQQNPTPLDGDQFKYEWFRRYRTLPENLSVYITADFAVSEDGGDFTEIAVWGVDESYNIYAIDWWSGQTTSLKWVEQWKRLVNRYRPNVFITEKGVIWRAMKPVLRKEIREGRAKPVRFEDFATTTHKVGHAKAFQALAENGLVHFPDVDWGDRVISQLVKFPAGKYDDAVDACSLLGRYLDHIWANQPKPQKREFNTPVLEMPALTMMDMEPNDGFKRRTRRHRSQVERQAPKG